MKLEHIAVAVNSEKDGDKFFLELLGLKKARTFAVPSDLMKQFFSIEKEHQAVRYEGEYINVEVFITNDETKAKDIFTHNCLLVKDPEDLIEKADSAGFTTIKVARKEAGFYYFIKDLFGNLYEIKILP